MAAACIAAKRGECLVPSLALLARIDGNRVGEGMWQQMSLPHLHQKAECPLPLLGLLASADGGRVGDDVWQQMSRLHRRQKAECLMQWSCRLSKSRLPLRQKAECLAEGNDVWLRQHHRRKAECPTEMPSQAGECRLSLPCQHASTESSVGSARWQQVNRLHRRQKAGYLKQ